MNKEELHRYVAESKGNEKNICQIFAMRGGKPVYEDCWHGFDVSDAVHVMSVTKSVLSILTGIAADRGAIQGVDQKVLDFFPDYKVKRGEKTIYDVTIRHLLTMTAPYKYRCEPWVRVCTSSDWTKAALDLLGGRKGITGEFKYATLGIQILAGIIENATGERCIDLANKALFAPLGIPEHAPHGDSSKEDQLRYVMSKSPHPYEWYTEPAGSVTAGWGLCLSARDMARIGWMLLNGGEFNGSRILSADWISQMTSPHLDLGEQFGNMSYGYLWYRPIKGRKLFAALGDGGTVIYADPDTGITVGLTGTFKPKIFDRVAFIEKYVVPLVLSLD
ncbi:MAG: serine hydrolase [Eubacterium sp.]|nr:serine hydrolase [Eubacterium sp.]